ncbi:hypothetical protein DL89DRAFT_265660 [Linderina pennispora]|uniref:Uncharacterized protein n=1 Tax=Linderina pennispora TaxID=61395 RepID=A0A1Y1WEL4_9FUNG|nr:uncharacterized protein DL89DRAFT_265660 [Linderina pennispora]ORX71960.1 hypothetical protein DL89DRAFT_265660 [Linderina pennispora]
MGSFGFANGQPFSLLPKLDKREIAQAEKTIVCATATPIPRPLQGSFLGGLAIAYIGVVVLVALIPFSHLGPVRNCYHDYYDRWSSDRCVAQDSSVKDCISSGSAYIAAPTSAAPTSAAPKLAAASILAAAGLSTSQPAWQVGTRPVRHMQPSIIVPIDVYSGLYRQKRGQKKALDKKHTSQKNETESATNHLAGVADQCQQDSTKAKQAKPTQPISVTGSVKPANLHLIVLLSFGIKIQLTVSFLEKQWPSSALTQSWSLYVDTGNVAGNFLVPSNFLSQPVITTEQAISDVFMDIDTESFGNPSTMDDVEFGYGTDVEMEDVKFGYTTDIMMDNFEFGCITDIEMENMKFRYHSRYIEMEDTELRYLSAVKMEDIGFRYIADVEMEDAEFK